MNIEYKKELPEHGIMSVEDMNSLGAEGWDNYAITGGVFYFKRENDPLAKDKERAYNIAYGSAKIKKK